MPFSGLPAVSALVTDAGFFQSILSLLSYNPLISSGSQTAQKQGRKRSPSEDMTSHNASRKKLMLSSTPISSRTVHDSTGGEDSIGQLADKGFPVYAATILYSVFQHADHWPVQIMKAFAEDSFGPRNWVDDDRCRALVSNLEISLIPSDDNVDQKLASAAEDAEAYFSSLLDRASPAGDLAALGGGKIASSSSQLKTLSTKEKRKQAKAAQSSDSSSSSSGEEEVLTVSSSLSLPPQQSHADMSSPLHTIFQTKFISKKQPRPRYHVHSLELALESISDALQGRLNSKSKQNSRLLQILPSFLSIPRARCLASRHLERWLQSPALAGLARTLFSRIVQDMCCVEPPLHDDLEVVHNILKLNLKTSQLAMQIEHITSIVKKA